MKETYAQGAREWGHRVFGPLNPPDGPALEFTIATPSRGPGEPSNVARPPTFMPTALVGPPMKTSPRRGNRGLPSAPGRRSIGLATREADRQDDARGRPGQVRGWRRRGSHRLCLWFIRFTNRPGPQQARSDRVVALDRAAVSQRRFRPDTPSSRDAGKSEAISPCAEDDDRNDTPSNRVARKAETISLSEGDADLTDGREVRDQAKPKSAA